MSESSGKQADPKQNTSIKNIQFIRSKVID